MPQASPRRSIERIRDRRARHLERSRWYRLVFATAGFVVLGAGIALLVLPGPGLLVMALGLAMLALEFAWAERALGRTIDKMDAAKTTAANASRVKKAVAALVIALGAVVAVGVVLTLDVPVLPF